MMDRLSDLQAMIAAAPKEHGARLDLSDGIPILRAPPELQERIEDLLFAQQERALTEEEHADLDRYQSLDDFFSLVNRLIRNELARPHASAAE